MTAVTIRGIEDEIKEGLPPGAVGYGWGMRHGGWEVPWRAIGPEYSNDIEAIRRRFAGPGGVKLGVPPREPMPDPPRFRMGRGRTIPANVDQAPVWARPRRAGSVPGRRRWRGVTAPPRGASGNRGTDREWEAILPVPARPRCPIAKIGDGIAPDGPDGRPSFPEGIIGDGRRDAGALVRIGLANTDQPHFQEGRVPRTGFRRGDS